MDLSGKQKKYLRGLAHGLKPVVHIGRGGLTDGVFAQLDTALTDHELVKLKFGGGFEDDRDAALDRLVERTGSQVAGTIGRTAVVYRAHPEEPEIRLP